MSWATGHGTRSSGRSKGGAQFVEPRLDRGRVGFVQVIDAS
jgi:hypothetical protein